MPSSLRALSQRSHHILRLPSQAQQVVDAYLHINVDGAQTPCPYHINPGLHSINRALLGKGSPQEIEALAAKWFEKYAMHTEGDGVRLQSFLLACGIGVDCSGFAAWVLNGITETRLNRPIWKCLQFPGLRRNVVSKIRPIENISANLLTGPTNSEPVVGLSRIKPGDLIRAASWRHVVVITEVGIDESGKVLYFQYAQSNCMYGEASGVRTGYAIIKNPEGSILQQNWFDNYPKSIIEELIAEGGEDSRVVRLKALA